MHALSDVIFFLPLFRRRVGEAIAAAEITDHWLPGWLEKQENELAPLSRLAPADPIVASLLRSKGPRLKLPALPANASLDELLDVALALDDYLLALYGSLAESADSAEARRCFGKLCAQLVGDGAYVAAQVLRSLA